MIRPSPKEVKKYEKDGVQLTWEIDEQLFESHSSKPGKRGAPHNNDRDALPAGRLLDTLQQTIGKLEQQLDRKDEQLQKRAEEVERLQKSLQHSQIMQSQLAQKAGLPALTSGGAFDGQQGSDGAYQEPTSIWSTSVNDLVLRLFRR
jgi:hypothetical protein